MVKYVLLSQDGGVVIQPDMESNHLFLCAKLRSAFLSQQKLDHHHHHPPFPPLCHHSCCFGTFRVSQSHRQLCVLFQDLFWLPNVNICSFPFALSRCPLAVLTSALCSVAIWWIVCDYILPTLLFCLDGFRTQ